MVATEARSPDRPGVFILACSKCTRELELHGREDILSLRIEAAGWVRHGDVMVCQRCPAPREQAHNKARERERRARRMEQAQ